MEIKRGELIALLVFAIIVICSVVSYVAVGSSQFNEQKVIKDVIVDSLKKEWQPKTFNITSTKNVTLGEISAMSWLEQSERAMFSAFVHVGEYHKLNDFGIMIGYTTPLALLNESSANQLVNRFFNAARPVTCNETGKTVICEALWVDNGAKNFICVATVPSSVLISISIPKTSINYEKINSCNNLLKQK